MRAVRSGEVVNLLPFVEFGLEIDVAFVIEELIELLLIGTVGSFDFAVQLRCAALYVGVPDPKIFTMPVELDMEFVTIIRMHLANAKRELFAAFSFEGQKRNVHLDVVFLYLLLKAFGVRFAHGCASGQSV